MAVKVLLIKVKDMSLGNANIGEGDYWRQNNNKRKGKSLQDQERDHEQIHITSKYFDFEETRRTKKFTPKKL